MTQSRAGAIGLVFLCATLVLAGCAGRRGEANSVDVVAPESFADCARADDPPTCLITAAAQVSANEPAQFLEVMIEAGAVNAVRPQRALVQAGTQGLGRASDGSADSPALANMRAAGEAVATAGIALAAAAQIADDPFANAEVKRLVANAGRTPQAAHVAATLWSQSFASSWRVPLVRPRGLSAIWRAVIAAPPSDTRVLAELADGADAVDFHEEALMLWRSVLQRRDVTEEDRRHAEARLTVEEVKKRYPDLSEHKSADVALRMFASCAKGERVRYSYTGCRDDLGDMATAGGLTALKASAEDCLRAGRGGDREPADRAVLFALASEAYRLLGDSVAAVAVAREGLPFVAAVLKADSGTDLSTPEERRRAVLTWGDDGATAPAIALYRAGAREEALKSGFLGGYARFKNAVVAGEAPDPQWVVDDRAPSVIRALTLDLIEAPRPAIALRFHEALRCDGSSFYETFEQPSLEGELAVVAALAGLRSSMRAHLAAGAAAIDGDEVWSKGAAARGMAVDWRRGLIIAERAGAADDAIAPAACAKDK